MTGWIIAGTAIALGIVAAVEIRIRRRGRAAEPLIAQAVELARREGPYR